MRSVRVLAVFAALVAGCSAPADVVVSRADETGVELPAANPLLPTSTAAPAGDPERLLLQESDLPGWIHVGPQPSGGEPTFTATDCAAIAAIWTAMERPGVRSHAGSGDVRLRSTVVEFDTVEAADALLDAAASVPAECTTFVDGDGATWWSEPVTVPAAVDRGIGIVVGSASVPAWAIAFWRAGPVVVIADVRGDGMWLHVDEILATAAARIDGRPAPLVPVLEVPTGGVPTLDPPTTTPGERPTPTPNVPAVTVPPPILTVPSLPSVQPGEWPPSWEDWAEHALAALVPAPEEFGAGWVHEGGRLTEAAPPDPDDVIPGCSVPAPPTLDGISVDTRREDSDGGDSAMIELEIGQGSAPVAQALIDALRAVADCDLTEAGFPGGLSIHPGVEFEGADDAVVLTGTVLDSAALSAVIVAVRYDELVIAAFVGTDQGPTDTLELGRQVVRLAAARR